ncbi:tyrosine-type recombinase/integrase [Pseudonocardia sp. RS010]|uniref:tyrosine-type recombinase/integrase n=1 Tax=Pseudonocardia sp. RS010 TaxID=3385979 RepID=UPI0039A1B6FB
MDSLDDLLIDFRLHLVARNRAPRTVTGYVQAGEAFVRWLRETGRSTAPEDITHRVIEAYLVALADRPQQRHTWKPVSAATVAHHYRSLQQWFKYLVREEVIAKSPFDRLSPPHVPEKPVPILADPELKALLAITEGRSFEDRRDHAIIRMFLDTGMRLSELTGIRTDELDFDVSAVPVLGKGRRKRLAVFGNKTTEALRRYLRVRRNHEYADRPRLWLSQKGEFTEDGVRLMLTRRGNQAGIRGLHAHRFRHTFAHRWKASGGDEESLMRLAGWKSRQMVDRYGASAATERAREAHRRKGLGDRF